MRGILSQAAIKLGIQPDILDRYDERSTSMIENIVQSCCFGKTETLTCRSHC
jgi:hypothetical protein